MGGLNSWVEGSNLDPMRSLCNKTGGVGCCGQAADLRPFSEYRVELMSGWAHCLCFTLFFVVGAASYVIFGADVRGDVLINLTHASMADLVGP